MREPVRRRQGPAARLYHAACHRRRLLRARLLPEDRSHRQLEIAPASRHAQPALRIHELRQLGIISQRPGDHRPIRIQIKHLPDPVDHEKERARFAEIHAHSQRAPFFARPDLEISVIALQGYRPAVPPALNRFHTGDGARRKIFKRPYPVVRRPEVKMKKILAGVLHGTSSSQAPNLDWRAMVNFANTFVETPHAAESGSDRHLRHRQARLVDQFFRKM
jgi:hypothetical protein